MNRIQILLIFILSINNYRMTAQERSDTYDKTFKDLFVEVQMQKIFHDNKTFVDAIPYRDTNAILLDYQKMKSKRGFSLKDFVTKNFNIPAESFSADNPKNEEDIIDHINNLWKVLERQPDKNVKGSSLLPLLYPYIVPGGRFREVYYWDSYFTMLGLCESKKYDLVESMVRNFAYMLKQYGHIPNGNRSYYLSRSQPPFFSLMVELLASLKGDSIYTEYQTALEIEYNYWMDRSAKTSHVVRLNDGSILNRYWDQLDRPRQESFYEDSTLVIGLKNPSQIYRDLRSGAESGWDFSSRWLVDSRKLETIRTTDILPVDLNCLLYHLEATLVKSYSLSGELQKAKELATFAQNRLIAVNKYLYNPDDGWYYDYIVSEKKRSAEKTIAGMSPFFFKIAPNVYIGKAARIVANEFLQVGGLVTSLKRSGQQWDAPNGWAPLQWITIIGLRNYKEDQLAEDIARRWIDLNKRVYKSTGKLMEKYNVEDMNLTAGGGEYPAQDGFGWTNGVLQALMEMYK